jgi:hypothetical protein
MKILVCNAFLIPILTVALGVNGAPLPADSATATKETPSAPFITPRVAAATNPGHPAEHTLAVVGSTFSDVDFLAPHRDEPLTRSGANATTHARAQLFGPPKYSWQNLPYRADAASQATPIQTNSNLSSNELQRSVEESKTARMQHLAREESLKPVSQADIQLAERMGQIEDLQTEVSFSGDQINILNTFLK